MASRPQNIGIKAVEIYFPSQVRALCYCLASGHARPRPTTPNSPKSLTSSPCPLQYVEQSELEKFDGVSSGKYTIGLGQTKMSFCDDREGQ